MKNKKIILIALSIVILLVVVMLIIFSCNKPTESNYSDEQNTNSENALPTENIIYEPQESAIKLDEESGIIYVDNMIIIIFEDGVDDSEVYRIIDSVDGKIVGQLPFIDQYQVQIAGHSLEELTEICESLNNEECVVDATFDFMIDAFESTTSSPPNDPWGNEEIAWNENDPDENNWWLESVSAISAWEYNDQLSSIKIGILDDGFDSNHEDLKNIITYIPNDNFSADHGTHVAGIIGAEANNGVGITGIVHNCEILLFNWKKNDTLIAKLTTVSRMFSGFSILVENGAKVINCSFGYEFDKDNFIDNIETAIATHTTACSASSYMSKLIKNGYDFVVVQAAGNENGDASDTGYFASISQSKQNLCKGVSLQQVLDRIIVVGAVQTDRNHNYVRYSSSNYGDRVDVWAPGHDIYSTIIDGYGFDSGTSMAAPIVTGIASMVWAANPELTGAEVKAIVCDRNNTMYDVYDKELGKTYRMVNAYLSVKSAIESRDCSEGLEYALEYGGSSYTVVGIGTCTDTDIIIPSVYNGLPVTSINTYAFHNCTSIKSIVIPDSIYFVGPYAFNVCSSLHTLRIGNSVNFINAAHFSGCYSLTNIEVDNSNPHFTSIDGNLYSKNKEILIAYAPGKPNTSFTIPNFVKEIDDNAFSGCKNLIRVIIPNSVTTIGGFAFGACDALVDVQIPNSVTSIELCSFQGCSFVNFVIPNSVSTISYGTFSFCDSLTSVTIPNSVTIIDECAFDSCISLTTIKFKGTKSQWNNIQKGDEWNEFVPATEVICSDGTISLK